MKHTINHSILATNKAFALCCGAVILFVGSLFNSVARQPALFAAHHRELLTDVSTERGYGTHYVTVFVGNPPQALQLAVATGSDYTSFPCQGCNTCRTPHFQYRPESVHQCPSSCVYSEATCNDAQPGCHVNVKYTVVDDLTGEGYHGIEITDKAYVDFTSDSTQQVDTKTFQKESFPLNFVCQQDALGGAILADGFLGLSTSELSFVNQLYNAKKIQHRMFSLCFRDFDDYHPYGTSAGHVTFGHVDHNLLDSPLVWAANTAEEETLSSYAIHIRRIYMGMGGDTDPLKAFATGTMFVMPIDEKGDDAKAPSLHYANVNGTSGMVLIQTNQPTSMLDKSLESGFKESFFKLTGLRYEDPAFPLTEEQFERMPTIFIQIQAHQASQGEIVKAQLIPGFVGKRDRENPYDIILAVPPEHYLIHLDGMAFPTIRFGSHSRIASNVLQNHEVVFDLDHQRIGFAQRRNCPAGLSLMALQDGAGGKLRGKSLSNGPAATAKSFQPGEVAKNGEVLVPENRDFVVVSSDGGDPTAVGDTNSSNQAGNSGAKGRSIGSSKPISNGQTSGQNGELDDGGSTSVDSATSNKGRTVGNSQPVGAEVDDSSQSGGEPSTGRQSRGGSQPIGVEVDDSSSGSTYSGGAHDSVGANGGSQQTAGVEQDDSSISDNFQPGVSNSGGVVVEGYTGLPTVQRTSQALRIGPGAVSASEALGDMKPGKQGGGFSYAWNLIAVLLFFLGFALTAFFTQDSLTRSYLPSDSVTGDDTDDAKAAWQRGGSFYKKRGSQMFVKRGKSFVQGKSPRKSSCLPFVGGKDDISSGSPSTYGAKRSGKGGKLLDDRSYYTRDDRTAYTRDDKSYYTSATRDDRPYYDARSVKSFRDDKSFKSHRSSPDDRTYYQGRSSMYSRGDQSGAKSPYDRTKSPYSQGSANYGDEGAYYEAYDNSGGKLGLDQSQQFEAPYSSYQEGFEGFKDEYGSGYDSSSRSHPTDDNSGRLHESFSSEEESIYYPKKASLKKFIKPVGGSQQSGSRSTSVGQQEYDSGSAGAGSSTGDEFDDEVATATESQTASLRQYSTDGTYSDVESFYADEASWTPRKKVT